MVAGKSTKREATAKAWVNVVEKPKTTRSTRSTRASRRKN